MALSLAIGGEEFKDVKVKVSSTDSTTNFLGSKLVEGANITLNTLTGGGGEQTLEIAASAAGETNTMSNVGAGVGVFKQKTGVDFELKSITGVGGIVITSNVNDVEIDGSGITASPAGANTEIQFNNAGSFGANSNFTYNTGTDVLTISDMVVSDTGKDLTISRGGDTQAVLESFDQAGPNSQGRLALFYGDEAGTNDQIASLGGVVNGTNAGRLNLGAGGILFLDIGQSQNYLNKRFQTGTNRAIWQNTNFYQMTVSDEHDPTVATVLAVVSRRSAADFELVKIGGSGSSTANNKLGRIQILDNNTIDIQWASRSIDENFIDAGNNFLLGAKVAGTTAVNTLGIAVSTAPTTNPGDMAQLYTIDHSGAGTGTLHVENEEGHIFIMAQSEAYTLNAVAALDRTLLASASATTLNNNNVLAALITDLKNNGFLG